MSRQIKEIAADIKALYTKAGKPVYYAAAPYLDAALCLNSVNDNYYADSGKSVVLYLLSNLTTLRGPEAKALKAELKAAAGIK